MWKGILHRLPTTRQMRVVAIGDIVAIGLFVTAGELSHGNPVRAGSGTFLAFAAAWLLIGPIAGMYGATALDSAGRAAGRAGVVWIPTALVGHVIRAALVPGATFAPTFVLVSIVGGGALLAVWRGAAASLFGS